MTWSHPTDLDQIKARLLNLERYENATYLTLTRTATLSITTAGVIVTWQSEVENVGSWTWSGTQITVPLAGYYHLSVKGSFEAKDGVTGEVVVNSVTVCTMGTGDSSNTLFRLNSVRFYKAGDVVQVRLLMGSATHTLQVVTEDSAGESPMLHMVML